MISKPITRLVAIRHQPLRVDVRAGDGTGTPLRMCRGIEARFELLQSLVDAPSIRHRHHPVRRPRRRRLRARRQFPRPHRRRPATVLGKPAMF